MNPPIENRPDVAKHLAEWRKSNDGKVFILSDQADQDAFLAALTDLGRHIAHTARQAKIHTINSKTGLTTVYLNVEN